MRNGRLHSFKWARWLLGLLIVLLAASALGLLLAPRPVEVETAVATVGPIEETVADQGTARVREAYVVASPVAGRLERVALHVGDRVRGGSTVIARVRPASADPLDPRSRAQAQAAVTTAAAAVEAATAERDRLSAEARKAEGDLARTRALADRGFASRQALDAAQASARASAAAVQAAQAQVGMRRSELAAARAALIGPEADDDRIVVVTSPASGYVTRVLQESARAVPAGEPLVEISDQGGLEAAIEFMSQDAVRIREGMPAEIYDWGGPRPLSAIVRRVEPHGFTKISALGVEEQRVLVLLQFSEPPEQWRSLGPGYRLWGRVALRRAPSAIKVPLGALVRRDGGWAVFRLADRRARLTKVGVGAMTDREAEIRSGLSSGQAVVVFPSDRVRDGVWIKAVEPN